MRGLHKKRLIFQAGYNRKGKINRMFIENSLIMQGDWLDLWRFSSEIERWAERLPHYRKVSILETLERGKRRKAFMSAWRGLLPVSWRTIQTLEFSEDPSQARILYNHIGGVTKGMGVIWSFEPLNEKRYRVVISHDWTPHWLLLSRPAAYLIQTRIVHNIADKTLSTIKGLVLEAAGRNKSGPQVLHKAAL